MRFRFSLRTLFILVTLLIALFYVWKIRPSQLAAQCAAAVNAGDYAAADRLFRHAGDRFLAGWADQRWAFGARGDLQPLTLGQLLAGRRHVVIYMSYFEFDHRASQQAHLAATPLGLASPVLSTTSYGDRFIDPGSPCERCSC